MSDNKELDKQLEETYAQITKLVREYNKLSNKHKIGSQVGCIITPSEREEGDDDDYYDENNDYSTEGWMPSSLGC